MLHTDMRFAMLIMSTREGVFTFAFLLSEDKAEHLNPMRKRTDDRLIYFRFAFACSVLTLESPY